MRRLHRRRWERALSWFGITARRYGCRNVECDWVGRSPIRYAPPAPRALVVEAPEAPPVAAAQAARRWRGATVVLAAFGVAMLAAAPWRKPPPAVEMVQVGPHLVPRGQSYDGDELPAAHPLVRPPLASTVLKEPVATAALTLRRHCAWGDPGRDPYRGTVEEALESARLPAEVVQTIAAQVKAGKPDDRLTITTTSIRGDRSGAEFSPKAFALTYGRTLCVGARVNFKRDHFERASLYQAADYRGKVHSVMVPDVCGNVSVLGSEDQLAARTEGESVLGGDDGTGPRGGAGGAASGAASAAAGGNVVSEPPTWAAVGLALLLAAAVTARRGRAKRRD